MIMLYINNKSYTIPKNFTILQAMEFTGNIIPHFCYHETLLISGNCRMCLVEVEKMPKPAVACSLVVLDKMKIFTNTPLIQKVRESILEFLLINHPLDCPICDQGGECDLQDYSLNYGTDRSRFFENKRSVSDKSFNILIKSIMSRCIHCTRCIRFMSDVVSLNILGTTGRGNAIEIGTYFDSIIKNEFSGNIIDLCPVGALTSKVYSFKARPWELRTIEFIDVFDSMTIPIQLHLKSNNNINRITPFKNFEINNFWISDRVRFSYDAFNMHKLENPLIKRGNQFIKTSWRVVFTDIHKNIKLGKMVGIFGEHVDISSLYIFKFFLNSLGSSDLINNNISILNNDYLKHFLMDDLVLYNYNIYLLVGFDPRFELSILNLKLKEISVNNINFECYSIGKPLNLNFKNIQLGWNMSLLFNILSGKNKISKKLLNKSQIFINNDLSKIFFLKGVLTKYNINISFVNSSISKINSNYLNTESNSSSSLSMLKRNSMFYFLDCNVFKNKIKNNFVIFQGSLGNDSLQNSNIILPTNVIYEKSNILINIFGKIIKTSKIAGVLKNIRHDYKILISLLIFLNIKNVTTYLLNYFLIDIIKLNYPFNYDIPKINNNDNKLPYSGAVINKYNKFNTKIIESIIYNFYTGSKISELSLVMKNCSKSVLIHNIGYSTFKKLN